MTKAFDLPAIERFWTKACKAKRLDRERHHYPWRFADSLSDGNLGLSTNLLELVRQGKKRGTCPCRLDFEHRPDRPMPKAGDYWIVTGSDGKPACVVEVEKVEEKAFCDVGEDFAQREGEADSSFDYWYGMHFWWVRKVYKTHGVPWTEKAPLIHVWHTAA